MERLAQMVLILCLVPSRLLAAVREGTNRLVVRLVVLVVAVAEKHLVVQQELLVKATLVEMVLVVLVFMVAVAVAVLVQ
jgi:hypothetical protein